MRNLINIISETMSEKDKTLYVSRKLLNTNDFIGWAKSQGFKNTTSPDELHVTITYSSKPVDWSQMKHDDSKRSKSDLIVPEGSLRSVEPLGKEGAVVLLFNSSLLSWRHEDMLLKGASWDFPEYQTHVTISYDAEDVDLSDVKPYLGKLEFGSEVFAEVDEDWSEDK